jgi:hypothetical protein
MLTDTINRFRARGYTADFAVDGQQLRCSRCGERHRAEDADIVDVARFEGMSDPDDEAVLFALHCHDCGARGLLVTAYGPAVDRDTAAVLIALHRDGRRGRRDGR